MAGCLLVKKKGKILVCREERNLPPETATTAIISYWDERFAIHNPSELVLELCALGKKGWAELEETTRLSLLNLMPMQAALSYPCFRTNDSLHPLTLHPRVEENAVEQPSVTFFCHCP